MSRAVLISIQPKWCELIASGKKTVEVRKTKPNMDVPFKCYIYQTRRTWAYDIYSRIADWQSKVIGEFVCDYIEDFKEFEYGIDALHRHIKLNACIGYRKIYDYLGFAKCGYGWHISNLVIYDKPKELSEFYVETCISFSNGFCNAPKFECGFQHCIYQGDIEPCVKRLKRPPQSWCYVEERRADG